MMIFILLFILSWVSGILFILLVSFFSYEHLSIVDITSFSVFMLAGCLFLIPFVYRPVLKRMEKKIPGRSEMISYPFSLVALANLPVYGLIWFFNNNFYGSSEAWLLISGFATTGLVYGFVYAWRKKVLSRHRHNPSA